MPFSRRHYRFVSPPEDTPADIAARIADNAVLAQVRVEIAPKVAAATTVAEMAELLEWQSDRIAELRRERGLYA
jgi:hypothetical protein